MAKQALQITIELAAFDRINFIQHEIEIVETGGMKPLMKSVSNLLHYST